MDHRVATDRMRTVWPLVPLLCALLVAMIGVSAATPSLVDVLLNAFCPGQDECAEVIFLSGLQTTLTGIGAMVAAPILGALSDNYGRKPVFLLVMSTNIAPSLTIAYSRETAYVSVYWVFSLLGGIMREAGLLPLTFAFVADVVPDPRQRAPAIGFALSGISIGVLTGTLFARVLTTVQVFQMFAVSEIVAFAIVKVFLVESHPRHSNSLLLPSAQEDGAAAKLAPLIPKIKVKTMFSEAFETVRGSKMLRIMAVVAFLVHITETTLASTLLYYLKAVFGFDKNEFAEFMVIMGSVAILAQMVVYPVLAHGIGERGVLWVGLLGSAVNSYLYAFAWAHWVPYFACAFGVFHAVIPAAIGTIVSRGADRERQGKVQGLIASLRTVASIIGPIVLTPLTAAFLSEDPPFKFPGFTLMICGTAMILALFISLTLPRLSAPDTCFEIVNPTTDDHIVVNRSQVEEKVILVEP